MTTFLEWYCSVTVYIQVFCLSHSFPRTRESALQGQIQTCNNQLRRLTSSRSDKLAAFGEDMRKLVNELQRRRTEFRAFPKGPIGSMIQLKDYKWSTAIEQTIKISTLKAFVLDNQQDVKTFQSIAKRCVRNGPCPDAIKSRFQGVAYDVRSNVS